MRLNATLASAAWLLLALALPPSAARFALAPVRAQQVTEADLLYLFDRPAEPVFTLRGLNRDIAFDVPVSYLPERYKAVATTLAATARGSGVRLLSIPELDMTQAALDFADIAAALPFREGKYSRANPAQLAYAIRFQKFFEAANTNEEMLSRGVWARLHYHPEVVLDGWRGALSRRDGAQQGVQLPEQTQYFPEMYVDDKFFAKVREEMFVVPEGQRLVIPVLRNETQRNTAESKTWYWLEDTHLNIFHWHWHINYPPGEDDREYVDRDRRGELFVYFHRQMIARLNAERFANGVPRILPLDIHEPVAEAFFPKMTSLHQNRGYPGRQANTSLLAQTAAINSIDLWTSRYRTALAQKYMVTPEGKQIPLSGLKGLDTITNALEANSLLSPNLDFYGTVHNQLHGVMGLAHDPNHENYETISTMSVLATVRDTGFYRLHKHMDDLYEEYKVAYLQPYQTNELTWQDVSIESLAVRSDVSRAHNELHTFWQESDLDLSLGLAFAETGRAYGRFRHLQHEPFSYEVQVLNKGLREKRAYVRLFLITLTDEAGQPLELAYQQRYAIEMDRFEATLEPGLNGILRESTATPLTADQDAIYTTQTSFWGARRVNRCRCGWPQTLLVPRGNETGVTYKLFAMVTDYDQDKQPASANEICHDGWILCGVPGSDYYPDARAMGFPFDRAFRPEVKTLDDFLTDNMAVQDVVVKFDDTRVDPPSDLLPGGVSTSWMP
ncbi:Prophenoloxidase [Frankliniella occidentalis]|uniref:Phenoloxidase 2-like n=1 Tax=Frankliniella occidentalis TaxID=133901 RepID=A0A6J1SKT4_FRAOC|nr:phenoloxidase 2-like [Frankliniella occidentalis]KAE8750004.1 Prophenoloxidase [Frankliniella occidentalis]